MKLQLNEQTLNAYINEAIKEELNEIYDEETNLTFKVDFDSLGTPETKAKETEREWSQDTWQDDFADAIGEFGNKFKDTLSQIWKGQGINSEAQLRQGSFGYNNAVIPGGQKKHNQATRYGLIGALRSLGYSDRQIGAALKFGAIQAGHYVAKEFVPLSNQKAEMKKVAKSIDGKRSVLYKWYIGAREEDLRPIESFGDDAENYGQDTDAQEPDDITQGGQVAPSVQDDGQNIIVSNEQDKTGEAVRPQETEQEFPWDGYPYESFPWDDYLARPTPRATNQNSMGKAETWKQQPQMQTGQEEVMPIDGTNAAQTRPSFDAIPKVELPPMPTSIDAPEAKIEMPKAQTLHPSNVITAMRNIAKEDPNTLSNREKRKAINTVTNSAIKATRNGDYAGGDKNKQRQSRDVMNMARNNILRGDNNPKI